MQLSFRPVRSQVGPVAARLHPVLLGGTRCCSAAPHENSPQRIGRRDTAYRATATSNTKRWVIRRKAAVLAAMRSGGITVEEACRVYQLSEEELLAWQRAFEKHGLAGLHITRTSQYRASRASDVTE